ncbi:MAG TPA: sigma-70 family RNA polymerase sigma factor [Verrucomicrobiae bacterium]|nr:sigma-70 family RNA polymerase sigma factor [Verrucomicrobiae bacterium]
MMANDAELLGQFTRDSAAAAGQDAFAELVERHLPLVYSAALRQVRSPQLAEEVSQSVFTQLAHHATALKPETVLAAWLHRVTYHAAVDVVRREARRQARERIACEMSTLMNDEAADWTQIEPHLDQAVQSLDETDRTAILLRYFENKSLREVGETLGSSEDAAQKRVSRALDRLREYFVKNKIAVPAAGLAVVISANAIQAVPVGLSSTIAAASLAVPISATLTTAKIIAMTTIQKIAIGAVLVGAAVAIAYQQREVSHLRQQNENYAQQQAHENALAAQVQQLQQERDQASNALASAKEENASLKNRPTEVLKLRGEVGKLRDEKAQLGATTALSKLTATPEERALVREQQKAGMSLIYKELTKQLKLTPDQTGKFNDLLADHIMQGIDYVAAGIRDKTPSDQLSQIFASDNASLNQSIQDLLGADALAQYQDYTKNLLGALTTDQFAESLTGSDDEKKAKETQLRQAIQQEVQSTLANAGLPADFQTVPILNFVNIASEAQATQNLQLLQGIYQRVAAGAGSYLSPDEVTKFQAFITKAIANSTTALNMNRIMMSPIAGQ